MATVTGGIVTGIFGVSALAAPEPTTLSKFAGVAALMAAPAMMFNGQVTARKGLNNIFSGWNNKNPHSLDEPTVGDIVGEATLGKAPEAAVVGFVVDSVIGRSKVNAPHTDILDRVDTASDIVGPAHDVMSKSRDDKSETSDQNE